MKIKVENTVGSTWILQVLFVAIDGELSGARVTETKIKKYETTTFNLVNTGKMFKTCLVCSYSKKHYTKTHKKHSHVYKQSYKELNIYFHQ